MPGHATTPRAFSLILTAAGAGAMPLRFTQQYKEQIRIIVPIHFVSP
ncbi:MAG: hypothetical protein RR376_08600 [Janthinobacterium sp.]